MRRISISAALKDGNNKVYLTHLRSHGFEMGIGPRGKYTPHAHRGFTDVAFAPGGLQICSPTGQLGGLVHIVAPGNWFGPIEFLSDFWFFKFFASEHDICDVPDKLTDRDAVTGHAVLVAQEFDSEFSLHSRDGVKQAIRLSCHDGRLVVQGLEDNESSLLVEP